MQEDVTDTGESGVYEQVDCMESPRDQRFPLERQGSSDFPSLAQEECWPSSHAMPVFSPSPVCRPTQTALAAWLAESRRAIEVRLAPALLSAENRSSEVLLAHC